MGRGAVPASRRSSVRLPLSLLQPLPSHLLLHPEPFQMGKLRHRAGHQVPSPRGCRLCLKPEQTPAVLPAARWGPDLAGPPGSQGT